MAAAAEAAMIDGSCADMYQGHGSLFATPRYAGKIPFCKQSLLQEQVDLRERPSVVRGRLVRRLTLGGTVGHDDDRVAAGRGVAKCILRLQADRHGLANGEGRRDADQRGVRRAAGCGDDGKRPRGAFDVRAAVGDRHRVYADLERRIAGRELTARGVSGRLPVDVYVLCCRIRVRTTTKLARALWQECELY